MKTGVHLVNNNQRRGNVTKFMTPEGRRQIRPLKRQFDEYVDLWSEHEELVFNISAALNTARHTAQCLLSKDPFDAWAKLVKAEDEEFYRNLGISTAEEPECGSKETTAKVTKLITMQMRQQQIVEAKKKLEDYASSLGQFFRELAQLAQLESLKTALELAKALQHDKPLESWDPRERQTNGIGDEGLNQL